MVTIKQQCFIYFDMDIVFISIQLTFKVIIFCRVSAWKCSKRWALTLTPCRVLPQCEVLRRHRMLWPTCTNYLPWSHSCFRPSAGISAHLCSHSGGVILECLFVLFFVLETLFKINESNLILTNHNWEIHDRPVVFDCIKLTWGVHNVMDDKCIPPQKLIFSVYRILKNEKRSQLHKEHLCVPSFILSASFCCHVSLTLRSLFKLPSARLSLVFHFLLKCMCCVMSLMNLEILPVTEEKTLQDDTAVELSNDTDLTTSTYLLRWHLWFQFVVFFTYLKSGIWLVVQFVLLV